MKAPIRATPMVAWSLLLFATVGIAQTPSPDQPGIYATFDTSFGRIRALLYENEAKNTVRNFVSLIQGSRPFHDPATRKIVARPFYKDLLFHRVIPYFMIQTGSQSGNTSYDCGFTIPDEINPKLNFDVPGRLAMANTGDPNSGGCQLFITEVADTKMNGKYTIFGQVVEGMDVVKKIARVIVDPSDKPRFPIRLKSVTLKRTFQPEAK